MLLKRSLAALLLVFTALPLFPPAPALAAEPEPGDTRVKELEQQRQEQERTRLDRAARYLAAEQAAQAEQRRLEIYQGESIAATRRRVGGLALAMAATTGCLTGLTLYMDKKGVEAGRPSFRPISEGLGGFTVVTAALGIGFLISGMRSDTHDLALQVTPDRMLASLGWRFF